MQPDLTSAGPRPADVWDEAVSARPSRVERYKLPPPPRVHASPAAAFALNRRLPLAALRSRSSYKPTILQGVTRLWTLPEADLDAEVLRRAPPCAMCSSDFGSLRQGEQRCRRQVPFRGYASLGSLKMPILRHSALDSRRSRTLTDPAEGRCRTAEGLVEGERLAGPPPSPARRLPYIRRPNNDNSLPHT